MTPMTFTKQERRDLMYTLDPLRYIQALGFTPFPWQATIIRSTHPRKHINGARQAGKSTIISSKPCHRARFYPGSLSIILAATEKQAVENMERVKDFMARDKDYPDIVRDSDSLIELSNKSRILVVPATEKAARGYSSPDIIMLDEDSRIDDMVYKSGVRPMLTDNEKCEVCAISTPNGRRGHFYSASKSKRWERYLVRAPWEISDDNATLQPAEPEAKFKKRWGEHGIMAYYSPRHAIEQEQQENLEEMGALMYRQEYLCEYVEPEDQVFSYDEIERAFGHSIAPLSSGIGEAPKAFEFQPIDFDAVRV